MPVYNSLVSRADAAGVIPEAEVGELIKATAAQSISLSLFRQINMGTAAAKLPYLGSLPDAYWVNGDTGLKQTTDLTLASVPLVEGMWRATRRWSRTDCARRWRASCSWRAACSPKCSGVVAAADAPG